MKNLTIEELVTLTSQQIIERLQAADWSKADIAKETGITQGQLSRVASGEREMRETSYRLLLLFAIKHLT